MRSNYMRKSLEPGSGPFNKRISVSISGPMHQLMQEILRNEEDRSEAWLVRKAVSEFIGRYEFPDHQMDLMGGQ